jgi:hypothetical protein
MAINTALCRSYKAEVMDGVHSLSDEYRIALYTAEADLNASTEVYDSVGEVEGRGYDAGGMVLSGISAGFSGDAATINFEQPEWRQATFTAAGALVYNASKENRAVATLSFGGNVICRNGKFTVKMPSGENGLIRIR